jgi:hypothetical protein
MSERSQCHALVGDGRSGGIWTGIGSSLKSAAASRAGRVLIGVSAVACVAARAPVVLLLVPLFVVLLAVARTLGRSWSAALESDGGAPVRLPDPAAFDDARASALAVRLSQARESLDAVIEAGPRGAGFELTSALAGVPRTVRDVAVLLNRYEFVARFLAQNEIGETRDELIRLEGRSRKEESSREVLEPTINRCREHLEALSTLKLEAERLLGAAEAVVQVLEQLSADVVRLQLTRLDACDGRLAEAEPRAASLLRDVGALRDVLSDGPSSMSGSPERP